MLVLLNRYSYGIKAILSCEDYSITHCYDGQDKIAFSLQRTDSTRAEISERSRIYETTEEQTYIVNYIDSGDAEVNYTCDLDLTEWQQDVLPDAVDGFSACNEALTSAVPDGWTIIDDYEKTDQVILQLENKTPLEIALAIEDAFFCCLRFDNKKKTVTVVYPEEQENTGVRFVQSKNLRSLPAFQGKSSELVTRLYPYGKDGLTIADVNDGLEYIENFQYTDEIICAAWEQTSYDDPETLLRDAKLKLQVLSQPTREWNLQAYDLYKIDPDLYSDQKVSILDRVEIYDDNTGMVYEAGITKETIYPHCPQNNEFVIRSGWDADSTFRSKIEKMLSDKSYTVTRTGSTGYWTWEYNKKATTCKVIYRQQMAPAFSGYVADDIIITFPSQLEYCEDWDRTDFIWYTCTGKSLKVTPTLTDNEDGTFTISLKANKRSGAIAGELVVSMNFVDTASVGENMFNTSMEWYSGSIARYLYAQTNIYGYLMTIAKNRTVFCIGFYDNKYLILTQPEGQDYYRVGFNSYNGGITEEILDNSKIWTAGENAVQLYKENTFKNKLKLIAANTDCRCVGYIDGAYLVLYSVGTHYGIGFTDYDGGVIL